MMVNLTVNGTTHAVDADPDMPLLWALRDLLNLTGTKYGCGIAACGACTVHVDDQPVRSCQLPISVAAGKVVTTIEGVRGEVAEAVQNAWIKLNVPQCGYCQSGQVMSAIGLLSENRKPTNADIESAMSGNLCRCATYQRIRGAVKEAGKSLRG